MLSHSLEILNGNGTFGNVTFGAWLGEAGAGALAAPTEAAAFALG